MLRVLYWVRFLHIDKFYVVSFKTYQLIPFITVHSFHYALLLIC